MCRQLKVFPVVVSEETVDKVTLFCAAKSNGGMPPTQPNMQKQKSEDPTSNKDYQSADLAVNSNAANVGGNFEFGDFIRAFKVSIETIRLFRPYV